MEENANDSKPSVKNENDIEERPSLKELTGKDPSKRGLKRKKTVKKHIRLLDIKAQNTNERYKSKYEKNAGKIRDLEFLVPRFVNI